MPSIALPHQQPPKSASNGIRPVDKKTTYVAFSGRSMATTGSLPQVTSRGGGVCVLQDGHKSGRVGQRWSRSATNGRLSGEKHVKLGRRDKVSTPPRPLPRGRPSVAIARFTGSDDRQFSTTCLMARFGLGGKHASRGQLPHITA